MISASIYHIYTTVKLSSKHVHRHTDRHTLKHHALMKHTVSVSLCFPAPGSRHAEILDNAVLSYQVKQSQFSQHKLRHLFAVNTCDNCCFPWWLNLPFLAPCLMSKCCQKLFAFGNASTSLQRRHNGLSPLGTNTNLPFWI